MEVLLVNPPLRNLSNRVGVGFHLPLGLLMVGGADGPRSGRASASCPVGGPFRFHRRQSGVPSAVRCGQTALSRHCDRVRRCLPNARIRQSDPDFLNALYLCPHGWTQEGRTTSIESIIQPDQERWTYRCQVLRSSRLSACALFAWVKITELFVHVRWRWFWRMFTHPDREVRRLLRWCFPRITAVWFAEICDFLLRTKFVRPGTVSKSLARQLLPGARRSEADGSDGHSRPDDRMPSFEPVERIKEESEAATVSGNG